MNELITYSIFHTKNTKAQEEICFIVRREAEKVFSYPSEQTTDAHLPILHSSATHTPTTSPTMVTSPQSSPHYHHSSHNHSHHNTPPPPHPCHRRSSSQRPTRTSLRIRFTFIIMMGCTFNQDLIMISHHNIRGYHIHKAELQAFLEDHSPDVLTLNETFTMKGYKYNMPHYTAMTRNREHRGRSILATPRLSCHRDRRHSANQNNG